MKTKKEIMENKVTEVYVIIIEELDVVKIGISNNFVNRMITLTSAIKNSIEDIEEVTITLQHSFVVKDRLQALSLEKYLHTMFTDFRVIGYNFAGHTELFSKDVLKVIGNIPNLPSIRYYNPRIFCEPTEQQIDIVRGVVLSSAKGEIRFKTRVRGIRWLTGNILANYVLMCEYGVGELYCSKAFLNAFLSNTIIKSCGIFVQPFTLENLTVLFGDSGLKVTDLKYLPPYIIPTQAELKVLNLLYPVWKYRLECCIGSELKLPK